MTNSVFDFYIAYIMFSFSIWFWFKICNSRGNCQCDVGYAPPSCEESLSSPGGSVDDGFWILAEG